MVDEAIEAHVARVPGVAVYLFKDEGAAPPALMSNLRHNGCCTTPCCSCRCTPTTCRAVDDGTGRVITDLGDGIHQVRLNYGFMEDPDIPLALSQLHPELDVDRSTAHVLPRSRVGHGRQGPGHAPLA